MGLGVGAGTTPLCMWLLLIAFAVIPSSASARILLSDDEIVVAMEGRSLKVMADDYSDPTANRGHDPSSSRNNAGGGRHRGRKG